MQPIWWLGAAAYFSFSILLILDWESNARAGEIPFGGIRGRIVLLFLAPVMAAGYWLGAGIGIVVVTLTRLRRGMRS